MTRTRGPFAPRAARRLRGIGAGVLVLAATLAAALAVRADVPNRVPVQGTVPDPGTQQQELTNITFPAPYNVFEFVATCGACHGGTVDQQAGHFGNWAGSAMASAARDPVFRANQTIVNRAIQAATGKDGAGNMCFRCHSPNGWLSGRFDPTLNGAADGSTMIHTILLSTDDEGVMCETCHRTLDAVTMKRPDLDPMDAVWNMLAGIDDWPHAGMPYLDQAGDPTIVPGNPYGDAALQFADGMTYGGRYPGYVQPFWDDTPLVASPLGYMGFSAGGPYTGQTYGIFPPGWLDALGNLVGGLPAFNPDGSLPIQYDLPAGAPLNPNGTPNYQAQSISLEHPTFGVSFVEQPEFCGSCHEMTVPVLNHGMPEQRTYTEWKFSAYGQPGPDYRTCQSCHMPRLSHEYSDTAPVTLNADPVVAGWFPYAKSRTNTAFHKLAGANRDLPMMMKALYPEVDFEVIGGGLGAGAAGVGTGNDPRIFPGMLSNRDSMYDRNQRNTEITLQDAVDVQIVSGPTLAADGKWEVQVRVVNNTGHRIPSGYADGRRMWIQLAVRNAGGAVIYQSGHYDQTTARLYTDPSATTLRRALSRIIDGDANAVMVYERVTGACLDDGAGNLVSCTPSPSLLNDYILFDNRIPPFGFDYAAYRQAGVKFWSYNPATFVPFEDATRYPSPANFDVITYRFSAPAGVVPASVRAEAYWQTQSREFMEHLRANDTSTVRPLGPARVWDPNYPLAPNYLSDEFALAAKSAQIQAAGFIDQPLSDNWGGIAYAAWYTAGRGAPFVAAVADTAAALPGPVANLRVWPQLDAAGQPTGLYVNPVTGVPEPYTQRIVWDPVPGADGYLVWIKYGPGLTTASWDRLATLPAGTTELVNTALNINKTYLYQVQAFNGAGYGPASAEVTAKTPWDLPLPPETLAFISSTTTTITMSWYDTSDNEQGWVVRRLDVPSPPNVVDFPEIARFNTANVAGFGGVPFTDGNADPAVTWAAGYVAPQPGRCYNYVVEAYNASGLSGWNVNGPVQMCTTMPPGPPENLTATPVSGTRVDLAWTAATGTVSSYRLERALDAAFATGVPVAIPAPATAYSDLTVLPGTRYWYRLVASNPAGDSAASNTASVLTPGAPPTVAAPPWIYVPETSNGSVYLSWGTSATPGPVVYVVQESTSNVFSTVTEVYRNTGTSTTLPGRPNGTYYYRVMATLTGFSDSTWRLGTRGCIVSATVAAPPWIYVPATSTGAVALSWGASTTGGVTYVVEESTDNFAGGPVSEVYRNTDAAVTLTGKLNGTYYYRVMAIKAGMTNSTYRTGTRGCVVATVVASPPWIYVPASATGGIYLSWGASTTAGVTYVVEQSSDNFAGGPVTEVYRNTGLTTTLPPHTTGTYSFRVMAIKTGMNNSAYRTGTRGCVVP